MASNDPPDLPKLPPIRESAEHVLPPLPGGPERGWEEAASPSAGGASDPPRRSGASGGSAARRPRIGRAARRRRSQPAGGRCARTPGGATAKPHAEDGRRYSSAGNGLVVAVLALLFGALLNAPGMHKASFNKQPGTGRDVALALTGGLAGVSGALQLDRPRQLVQSVAGRSDADEIDVAIVIPDRRPRSRSRSPSRARRQSPLSRSHPASRSSRRRRSFASGLPATRS